MLLHLADLIAGEYTDAGDWSVIEMDASIICACMPGIRRLLKTLWPQVWSTTNRSNTRSGTDKMHRSVASNGGMDDKKHPGMRSNFIPLRDMDWDNPETSTATLVTKT